MKVSLCKRKDCSRSRNRLHLGGEHFGKFVKESALSKAFDLANSDTLWKPIADAAAKVFSRIVVRVPEDHKVRTKRPHVDWGNRHQPRWILYDIYCLMLLKYGRRFPGSLHSLLNRRDCRRNRCNCLKIISLPFRSSNFRLYAEALGKNFRKLIPSGSLSLANSVLR